MALGKHFLAIAFIEFAIPSVISFTLPLSDFEIFRYGFRKGSALIPAGIAIMAPFFLLTLYLKIMV